MATDSGCSSYNNRIGSNSKSMKRPDSGMRLRWLSSKDMNSTLTTMNCCDKPKRHMLSRGKIWSSRISKQIMKWHVRSETETRQHLLRLSRQQQLKFNSQLLTTLWLKTQPQNSRCSLRIEWSLTTLKALTKTKKKQFCTREPNRCAKWRWGSKPNKKRTVYGLCSKNTSGDNRCSRTVRWRRQVAKWPSELGLLRSSRRWSTTSSGRTHMTRRVRLTTIID